MASMTGEVLAYSPKHVSAMTWAATSELVLAVCDQLSLPPASRAKNRSHLAAFASWALAQGVAMQPAALLELDLIERYIQVGMPDAADSTRATRRAILRRIARRASPSLSQLPVPEPIAYRKVRPPYLPHEVGGFLRLIPTQPTPGRRLTLSAVLALGLGCGLDCRDMGWVRGTDLVSDELGAVRVTVCGGSRPRSITALQAYSDLLLDLAAERGKQLLIGGTKLGRHNVTSNTLARLTTDDHLPRLVVARLRSTWLADHLRCGTPLPVLMPAAGLKSMRPLEDLLEFLPAPAPEVSTAWLQGRRPDAAAA
jgi:hypothetical protein